MISTSLVTAFMISLTNLSMIYEVENKPLQVLNKINLTIEAGESAAIVGPSGSGKSTLLLLLAGLEQPSEGSIAVEGHDLSQFDAEQLADLRRDKLGIVFQSFHLIPSLSALGNVMLPLQIANRSEARKAALAMLDEVGLGHRAQHYPSQMSGGEQQRVAIARALVHEPKLLLADEPTGNLDRESGERISNLLFRLCEEREATLIMVTHNQTMAQRCQRQLRLQEGELVEDSRYEVPA